MTLYVKVNKLFLKGPHGKISCFGAMWSLSQLLNSANGGAKAAIHSISTNGYVCAPIKPYLQKLAEFGPQANVCQLSLKMLSNRNTIQNHIFNVTF